MKSDNEYNQILQNLKDAGCDAETIEKFFKLSHCEKIKLLTQHRMKLLDTLHKYQKKIDCLDYLIFTIRQAKNNKNILNNC